MGAGVGFAAHAVFGAEKGNELDVGGLVEDVGGGAQVGGQAGGVGDQTDALVGQRGEVLIDQDVDSQFDGPIGQTASGQAGDEQGAECQ